MTGHHVHLGVRLVILLHWLCCPSVLSSQPRAYRTYIHVQYTYTQLLSAVAAGLPYSASLCPTYATLLPLRRCAGCPELGWNISRSTRIGSKVSTKAPGSLARPVESVHPLLRIFIYFFSFFFFPFLQEFFFLSESENLGLPSGYGKDSTGKGAPSPCCPASP
jgi:hypothetical protein